MKRKIVIIGGGVGGLTAGIYAQKSGFDSIIIEKLPVVGGLCATWFRSGLEIDGCIHWIIGTREGDLNNMWNDVGAFKNDDVIYLDNFGVYKYKGETVSIYQDIDKLEQEFLRVAPEDEKEIKRFIKYVNTIYKMPLPVNYPLNIIPFDELLKVGIKELPFLHDFLKLRKMSSAQYATKFKSPILRYVIKNMPPAFGNAYSMIYTLGYVAHRNAGIPKGGSREFVNNLKNNYLKLGGEIKTNKSVTDVLINEKGVCYGVRLDDNTEIESNYVISTIDPIVLYSQILSKNFYDASIFKRWKRRAQYDSPSGVMVTFKVDSARISEALNHNYIYRYHLKKSISVGKSHVNDLILRNYSYDEKFIKNGKVTLTVLIDQKNYDFAYWQDLYKDQKAYKEDKMRIALEVKDNIINELKLDAEQLEIIDVFTPKTLNRYTGAYKGSYMPFELSHKNKMLIHNGNIKGLKNFYFGGQWAQMPGGLPPTLIVSRWNVQRICKRELKTFKNIKQLFAIKIRKGA